MFPFFYTFYKFGKSAWKAFRDPEFEALAVLAAVILFIGTVTYHDLEGWGWIDSLYFSVVTLATVGYGDFAPHTAAGKLFTVVYIFVGVGVLIGFINAVTHHTIEETRESGVIIPKSWLRRKQRPAQTKNESGQ